MFLSYEVPEYKKIRVIVDTDAACEADDPFSIAHALMSKKFEVKAILAEQFGEQGSVQKSYDVIVEILRKMNLSVPVFMGEDGSMAQVNGKEISPAAQAIIDEAMKDDEKPLYVLCLGAITNIAIAIKSCPDIVKRMKVVWIGGQNLDYPNSDFREFNSGNDIDAANLVVSSGVDFWLIPVNVYGTMRIGLAEIQKRIYPCGEIGQFLFENMINYNMSEYAGWTPGESWSLGDSPAVGVALDQNCGTYEYREAPIFNEDTTVRLEKGRPIIRVYKSIDSRFILEDFISKLEIMYS